jgi:hypothetical protein
MTAPVIHGGDLLGSAQDLTIALRADSGRYMARCNGCMRAAYPDNAAVHVEAHELAGAPWAKFKLRRLANGRHALIADTGNCVARCNGCVSGAAHADSAMIHVPAGQVDGSPWAQFKIERLDNGRYSLQADSGNCLARCNNCASASYPDNVFVHVSAKEVRGAPWAQWDIVTLID